MKKDLQLSIIILNYNTVDWLENVLSSIESFPPKLNFEVIVVDNASQDDSVSMVKLKFPKVYVVESKENGGFSKGNNLGIKEARGQYVMLLNSDAQFTSETKLENCISYLDKNESAGMLSPKLQLPDGSIDLASHRGEPTPIASLTYFLGLEKAFPRSKIFGKYHQTWKSFDETHEIEACSGAAMIVRSSALATVGLLDEDFFMYGEDLDWCKRFREKNFKIVFFPESVIIHHKYKSGQAKEKQPIDVSSYLHIPGFEKKTASKNSSRDHFFETMKQYYTKHYAQSSPVQTWVIHKAVDLMRWAKGR